MAQHQRIRSHLECGVVVGLRADLAAKQHMGFIEPAQGAQAIQQLVGQAMHHLLQLAMHIGVQAAEVGDPCGRAHATQKAIALHQKHAATRPRRGRSP